MALNIVDYLITSISGLPLIITGPGFLLCGLLAFRVFGFFMTFRWLKAATNLVYIFIVLLLMARFGAQIAAAIEGGEQQAKQASLAVFQYIS